MLGPRDICNRFEVRPSTLYNWKKTKPRLYNYLQHADYHQDRSREVDVLLEAYSKVIKGTFSRQEVVYLIYSEIEITDIEGIDAFEKLFIKKCYAKIPTDSELILGIYDKLGAMNIIEKYILYKRIYKVRLLKEGERGEKIEFYFSEFLAE